MNSNVLPEKLVDQLFSRMRVAWPLFGTTWKTDQLVMLARKEWASEIGNVSGEVLSVALKEAKALYINMAPTLPEFKACVRKAQKRTASNENPDLKYLSAPRGDAVTAHEHIANITSILKKAKSPGTRNVYQAVPPDERDFNVMKMLHTFQPDMGIVKRLKMLGLMS